MFDNNAERQYVPNSLDESRRNHFDTSKRSKCIGGIEPAVRFFFILSIFSGQKVSYQAKSILASRNFLIIMVID
jgi:hypothetical protein